jgi:hypothetical protein
MSAVRHCVPLLLVFAGCATDTTAGREGNVVALAALDEGCLALGPVSVRIGLELVTSEDARFAAALTELRRRAALQGATHLVVSRPVSAAMVSYGTTAAASGTAFRCPDDL